MRESIFKECRALIGIILASIIVHLIPFFLYGSNPLGYDTGFYRRYLIKPIISFPNSVVPGLGSNALIPRIILDLLRFTQIPTDVILYGSYIIFTALGTVAFYFLLKHVTDKKIAIAGCVLLTFSAIQYEAYWHMFFKQAFALPMLFLGLMLINKNSWWSIPITILIAYSHQTSAIIYVCIVAVYFLLTKNQRRVAFLNGIIGIITYLIANPAVQKIITEPPVGVFMQSSTFMYFEIPLLIMALFGIRDTFFKRENVILTSFAIVSFAFPLFQLPFYERIFVFTDIALVIVAAHGIKNLLQQGKKFTQLAVLLFFAWFVGNLTRNIRSLPPLATKELLTVIRSLDTATPKNATILTLPENAPWVLGWSHRAVIAPGLLGDPHNEEEWQAYWSATSTNERITFLESYPKPLYLFSLFAPTDKETAFVPDTPCVQEVAPMVFEFDCKK